MDLSDEQNYAFSEFKKGKNMFVTGPAGTGKSYLIQNFINYCIKEKKRFQVCGTTGISSVILQNGAKTIHSWSGIRIARGDKKKIIESVLRNKKTVTNWKNIQVLIIDEVSMMSLKVFELLNELACVTRKNIEVFGGIQVIFTGDFFQLPPVPTKDDQETSMFCFESIIWNKIFSIHIELKTNFRQKDKIFTEILQQIRLGEIDEKNIKILKNYVKREYNPEENNGIILTKLFAIKNKVDFVNSSMYNKINEEEFIFNIIIKTDCTTFLESGLAIPYNLRYRGISEKEKEYEIDSLINNTYRLISLKKSCTVMCTFNLDTENGICNGSQGVIIDFEDERPIVKFLNGITMSINIHYFQSEDYPSIAVGQIPLILCYALTIHKIQGSTLDMAEMDLGSSIFEYGQSYVSLSRVKSLDGLYLNAFNPSRIKSHPKVINFYKSFSQRSGEQDYLDSDKKEFLDSDKLDSDKLDSDKKDYLDSDKLDSDKLDSDKLDYLDSDKKDYLDSDSEDEKEEKIKKDTKHIRIKKIV
jgi:ATP-dependent DNA helicase PIF1